MKRYDPVVTMAPKRDGSGTAYTAEMGRASGFGEYIRHADYLARLAEIRAAVERERTTFTREAEEALDALLSEAE